MVKFHKGGKTRKPNCLNKVGTCVIHESESRGDRLAFEKGGEGSEHVLSFRVRESSHSLDKRLCQRTHGL